MLSASVRLPCAWRRAGAFPAWGLPFVRAASTAGDASDSHLTKRLRKAERGQAPSARHVLRKLQPATLAPYVHIEPKVLRALTEGSPVVALESTIISHGMPYPANVETAVEVEGIVARNGATPATIALLDGKIHIGLDQAALEALGKAGRSARKCSRRDFASVLSAGSVGATTVAGTMVAAHMVGIPVFVTGGIGGVHRGAESTWDVSADLTELGRTPVAVVCAGVKSILDIGKTLEVLETQGVPVVTYRSDEFPAFFSPHSGLPTPERADSTSAIARHILTSRRLGMRNGMVVAVPNPQPAEGAVVEAAIQQALREAAEKGVAGRDATPFLLGRIAELTGGESLRANIALVKNNAVVGAQIAAQLGRIQGEEAKAAAARSTALASAAALRGAAPAKPPPAAPARTARKEASPAPLRSAASAAAAASAFAAASASVRAVTAAAPPREAGAFLGRSRRRFTTSAAPAGEVPRLACGVWRDGAPLVVGGAVGDILSRPAPGTALKLGASNPGVVTHTPGGVGRNIAETVARLRRRESAALGGGAAVGSPAPVVLVTAVGSDPAGAALRAYCASSGVHVVTPAEGGAAPADAGAAPVRTATYTALLDGEGELVAAVADMDAFDALTPEALGLAEGRGAPAQAPPVDVRALLRSASIAAADGNLPAATLTALARAAASPSASPAGPVPLLFEPISPAKCTRALECLHLLAAAKPNKLEVEALAEAWRARMGLPPLPPPTPVGAGHGDALAADEVAVGDASEFSFKGSAEGGEGQQQGQSASAGGKETEPAATAEEEEGEADAPFDHRTLVAAQTVLAAMLRPGGVHVPLSDRAMHLAQRGLDSEEGEAAVREAAPFFAREGPAAAKEGPAAAAAARGGPPAAPVADPLYPGALLDGRKHLFVSLGPGGVLWLSCAPLPDAEGADLAVALPFFTAAQHPRVGFDFRLVPAPSGVQVRKATGAGDALVGSLLWALSSPTAGSVMAAADTAAGVAALPGQAGPHPSGGLRVGSALRLALAGSKVALETDPAAEGAGGAVPARISPDLLAWEAARSVPPIDEVYC